MTLPVLIYSWVFWLYLFTKDNRKLLKEGEHGLIFTCDPYSKIIKSGDYNTELLFGDASTVSLVKNK